MKFTDKKYFRLEDIDHNKSYGINFFPSEVKGFTKKYDDSIKLNLTIDKEDNSMNLDLTQTGVNFISFKEQYVLLEQIHDQLLENPYITDYQELIFE
tara:strand:+ start:55128 stop:55418 length:291 start_codon:yes stop_codon:yes gene_type:complete